MKNNDKKVALLKVLKGMIFKRSWMQELVDKAKTYHLNFEEWANGTILVRITDALTRKVYTLFVSLAKVVAETQVEEKERTQFQEKIRTFRDNRAANHSILFEEMKKNPDRLYKPPTKLRETNYDAIPF